jgi:rSAM/selenodomain-associated transferase 1
MPGAAIAVMAKVPRPGRVKTRLAQVLGAAAACRLYAAFIGDLDERLGTLRLPAFWFHWPADQTFGRRLRHARGVFVQRGGDLGERMEAAFHDVFDLGHSPVLMLGADVPHVPLEAIAQGIEGLASGHEVVLGPTADGGYYLIGLNQPTTTPFHEIAWGTEQVYAATLHRSRAAGLRLAELPPWFDLDDVEDLQRLQDCMARCSPALHRTMAALAAAGFTPREA